MKKLVFLFIFIISILSFAVTQKTDFSAYNLSGEIISGVRVVKVESFRYSYSPNVIVVNSGERVRIKLSTRDTEHGFKIPEINFDLKVKKGRPREGEFTAPKPGIYEIRCSVFCGSGHKEMKGRLVVK
ncbi:MULTISPECIES: cupredoxin domain-containing protein [Psychrilyobacter]|uniref:Cytochrome c oxidase subunit II n=1 Tax=Psychrilyobacter piezotolerans TaxID=2293438 RepID=A0ABX9KCU8_9FUSO|nr:MULTISPECIES: cupredoxin domain-containing protein [Psychrilyobacter]MCS5422997.1 cupredoxin domain-containing protein [Psychrilyobacter sp. S5]NDI79277.1 cytochrome c oxidase subunit II [Psychrilyobacter piezotolerans]RDE58794.1 cytochrome c oxidase subunit II [Psychrilyobacter sp. S5]REI39273.1 cytochrome c oxidase subunit II [Psychrilyobacter piezotolerans]